MAHQNAALLGDLVSQISGLSSKVRDAIICGKPTNLDAEPA
jgi:hypothetical protein